MTTRLNHALHLRRLVVVLALVGALELLACRAAAQLPTARLTSVFPPGGKAGTTFEVSVTGTDLENLQQLHFSRAGISAGPKTNEVNRLVVTISPEVPAGVYEARAYGRFGVSNPRAFAVGNFSELSETATNHSATSAMSVPLETTINGRTEANQIDYFTFNASKGQRVLIECAARALDSRLEPVLLLFDASGNELERERRGGLIDFTAPTDGQFALRVHDSQFRGGEDFFYRLTVSTGPHLDFIFPPVGVAGAKSSFTLFGRNLAGGIVTTNFTVAGKALEKRTVEIESPGTPEAKQSLAVSSLVRPADSVGDGFDYRFANEHGVSNPARISFATAPVVLEQEPNNTPAQAQTVSVPGEIAGQFFPAGDKDFFRFNAKKGDVLWVEIFSQRLGLATDPFAVIQRVVKNDKGEEEFVDTQELSDSDTNIGGVEFNTATRDPSARFEAKEDGVYQIGVQDLFNRGESNPARVYRLSLRKESPDFRLVAMPAAPPPQNKDAKIALSWTSTLRRSETIPIKVMAFRRDGFGGDIQLSVEGLPPGARAAETKIDAGKNSTTLLLTAADDAAEWLGEVRFIGRAKVGDTELVRPARAGTVTWTVNDYNTQPIYSRMARDFLLAVIANDAAPVSVAASEEKIWEAAANAKLQIPIKLARRGDFNETIKLKATGVDALNSVKELEFDSKTTNAVLELDLAQLKFPAGAQQFYLQAQTNGKHRRFSEDEFKGAEAALKLAEKVVVESPETLKKAKDELAAASKVVEEADAASKAAAAKLSAAKLVAAKTPADDTAVAARDAAEKEAAAAESKLKSASEAKARAEKSVADAEQAVKDAPKKKDEAANRLKEMEKKDVTYTIYSQPIRLKINAAP